MNQEQQQRPARPPFVNMRPPGVLPPGVRPVVAGGKFFQVIFFF